MRAPILARPNTYSIYITFFLSYIYNRQHCHCFLSSVVSFSLHHDHYQQYLYHHHQQAETLIYKSLSPSIRNPTNERKILKKKNPCCHIFVSVCYFYITSNTSKNRYRLPLAAFAVWKSIARRNFDLVLKGMNPLQLLIVAVGNPLRCAPPPQKKKKKKKKSFIGL